jgi:2-phosphosulfolactate phosphatase
MQVTYATLDDCDRATGTVIVIDVVRAFTTAAFAFEAGALSIILVSEVAEAFALRRGAPQLLLMGESEGAPVPGFDFGNSPSALAGVDLRGRRLVQRTSQGTQGVVKSDGAGSMLAASFVCAGATARWVRRSSQKRVTFVITGTGRVGDGDEDAACADYIAALLHGQQPDPAPYLDRVRGSLAGRLLMDPSRPEYPAADLPLCLDLDRFFFAMPVVLWNGHPMIVPIHL